MPAQTLTTDAFVLVKRPPAESFQSLIVFSLEKEPRALYGLVVLVFGAQRRHARRDAPLDVVLEARPLAHPRAKGATLAQRQAPTYKFVFWET